MTEAISLDELQEKLAFCNKMYDAIRLVDPVLKKVIEYRSQCVGETETLCYNYWENGRICDNCISVRAYLENKSFMKLEQSPKVIMHVTALPIQTAGRPVVLELLKNATDCMLIGSGEYEKDRTMRSIVHDLNDMVVKDHLTELYNRRFLDDRLPVDVIDATLTRKPLSVIFIDVNNMKAINDKFGHVAGDMVLKHAARIICSWIRADMDWVARYGGDEFFVCLRNTDNETAHRISERIRNDVAARPIRIGDTDIRITVSLGVITTTEALLTAEEIIHLADEKMYESKKREKAGGHPDSP